LKDIIDVPIETNGTGLSSGTFEFDGSGLVFHKASGEPFTVTYTLTDCIPIRRFYQDRNFKHKEPFLCDECIITMKGRGEIGTHPHSPKMSLLILFMEANWAIIQVLKLLQVML
jgi:hypothetical protein